MNCSNILCPNFKIYDKEKAFQRYIQVYGVNDLFKSKYIMDGIVVYICGKKFWIEYKFYRLIIYHFTCCPVIFCKQKYCKFYTS